MVIELSLPVSIKKKKPVIIRRSNVNEIYSRLDQLSPEQKAELCIWLAEQPLPTIDPIRLALASFNALKEDELPLFFEALKNSLDIELWELLTEN